MQIISINNLIEPMKNSYLVDNFDNDSEIIIPKKYTLNNLNITDDESFYKTIEILRYYMIKKLPFEIYEYVKTNKNIDLSDYSDFFFEELSLLKNDDDSKLFEGYSLFDTCLGKGLINLVKYLRTKGYKCNIHNKFNYSLEVAINNRQLNSIKYLHTNGYVFYSHHYISLFMKCGIENNKFDENNIFECFSYMHQNGIPIYNEKSSKWPDKYDLCSYIAGSGNLKCLKYSHENNIPWNHKTCESAVGYNHFDCFKYAYNNGCPYSSEIGKAIGQSGNMEILKFIHNKSNECSCGPDKSQCKHLHQYSWIKKALCSVALYSDFEMLNYLLEHGSGWDIKMGDSAVQCFTRKKNVGDCSKEEIKNIRKQVINTKMLEFIHKNGCCLPVDKQCKNKPCAHTPWDAEACSTAAIYGHLEHLKYLHDNGCPWDSETCKNSAQSGNIECLKYAHQNNCPMTIDTIRWCVSTGGTKECLQYAHENGCRWDESVSSKIIRNCCYVRRSGYSCISEYSDELMKSLHYVFENGCPYDKEDCLNIAKNNNYRGECADMVEFVEKLP